MVQQLGRVEVTNLSRQFKTSEATIRSDLKKLHRQGFVQRTHGGALNPELVNIDRSLHQKLKLHAEEKQRIGKVAAALIDDGESIILDSGTTTQQIAKEIKSRKNLKVITNGVSAPTLAMWTSALPRPIWKSRRLIRRWYGSSKKKFSSPIPVSSESVVWLASCPYLNWIK